MSNSVNHTSSWESPIWDDSPAPPTWGLSALTPSAPMPSWNITPVFIYNTLFGNAIATSFQVPTDFKWESEERRQATDDMYCFLKVIEWAQDFEEKIHHMFKSGRKALLFQCEENCDNCGEPVTHHYWGSQNTDPSQQEADMAFN
jgi:hypothetical protein